MQCPSLKTHERAAVTTRSVSYVGSDKHFFFFFSRAKRVSLFLRQIRSHPSDKQAAVGGSLDFPAIP